MVGDSYSCPVAVPMKFLETLALLDAQCLVAISDSWFLSQVQKNNPTDSFELVGFILEFSPWCMLQDPTEEQNVD